MKPRTDLEHVVLGVVWKKGPATAHAVRVEFSRSRSDHWSGSAGSIYPLMERLEEQGLVRSKVDRTQARERRLYRVTAQGLRSLRKWLSPPLDEDVFSVQYEPLRTRLYFLGSLDERTRRAFLDDAEAGLKRQLPLLEKDRADYLERGWTYSVLAVEGMQATCRARIEWIRSVRRTLVAG